MPFWFLLGRFGSLFEQMLTQGIKNKYVLSYFGSTFTLFPYIVMVGQIFGHSPLSWF